MMACNRLLRSANCVQSKCVFPSRVVKVFRHCQGSGTLRNISAMAAQAQVSPNMIKVGDKLPLDECFYILDLGSEDVQPVKAKEVFAGKKVVLFGLPGAFTAVCSSKHLPDYNARYNDLKGMGVDTIACTSVNDAFVMREWAKSLNVDSKKVMMLGDPEATFHRTTGLVQKLPGLGERPLRYGLYAEDGVVKALNVDEPGPKSYKVAGPQTMLDSLQKLKAAA